MPIKFVCPHCQKHLSVKDQLAGKKGQCPGCKKMVMVPVQTVSAGGGAPPLAPPPDLEALAAAALAEGAQEAQSPVNIEFTCLYCDANVKVGTELSGKQTPCPECGRIIKVPLVQKAAPRDWLKPQKQVGPSGAKREHVDLEGAWGTETSRERVSRQALVEADVLPEEREPLTVGQWLFRGTAAAVLLGGLIAGVLWYWNWSRQTLEDRAVAAAEEFLTGDAGAAASPEAQAQMQALLGEYYQLAGKRDDSDRSIGIKRLQLARQAAEGIADPNALARHCVLRDLLRVQRELFQTANAVDAEALLEEMSATLLQIDAGAPRADVLRELARWGVGAGRQAQVHHLIEHAIQEPLEQIDSLSILGQEMVRAGQGDEAGLQLSAEARKLHQAEQPFPQQLMVLLLMLKRPTATLEENREKEADAVLSGRVQGQARSGNPAAARKTLTEQFTSPTLFRVEALLALAEVLIDNSGGEPSQPILEEAARLANFPQAGYHRFRLVELAALGGHLPFAEEQAVASLTGPSLHWARLALLKAELQAQGETAPIPHARLNALPPESGALAAALALVARQQGRRDASAAMQWAESVEPETGRPFAQIGVGLAVVAGRR